MELKIGQCSMAGPCRTENEDVITVNEESGACVCLVVDGDCGWFGEPGSGAFLARHSQGVIVRELQKELQGANDVNSVCSAIHQSLSQANEELLALRELDWQLGAATAVLALWVGAEAIYFASVGDCLAYQVRDDVIEQLTMPDTVARALVKAGNMTLEQVQASPFNNILFKYIGCKEFKEAPEVNVVPVRLRDRFLLCSDGLWRSLTECLIVDAIRQHTAPQRCAEALCQLALERGSRDNVSCIVIDVV